MMKRIVWLVLLLSFFSNPVVADEPSRTGSPEQFLRYYFERFNERDFAQYDDCFRAPHTRIFGTEVILVTDASTVRTDPDDFLSSGWNHSRLNSLEIIDADQTTAIATMNFTRIDNDGRAMVTMDAYYVLTKVDEVWGISVMTILERP